MPTTQDTVPIYEQDNPDFSVMTPWEIRLWKEIHRTPEEIEASRKSMEPYFKPGRPLPPGTTLDDVFRESAWIMADMTDEQVRQTLEDIE